MKHLISRFVREDEGQDLVEYALLIAFIALACIIGLQQLGTAINQTYNSISTSLTGALAARTPSRAGRRATTGRPLARAKVCWDHDVAS